MKFRVDLNNKARLILGAGFALPFGAYLIYHFFAPSGVMQNHRASAGAYLYWTQSFLNAPMTPMQIYRPEFYLKEQSHSLYHYSKKIENLRKAGSEELVEGVHHPDAWH